MKKVRKMYFDNAMMDIYEKIVDGDKILSYKDTILSEYDIYKFNKHYYMIWWFDNTMKTILESTSLNSLKAVFNVVKKV